MCCDVGSKVPPKVPNKEELGFMGCDGDVCGDCRLYEWTQMMGEWLPLDGKCTINIKLGTVRADESKCQYYCKRGDV